jgi:hypothetical protein
VLSHETGIRHIQHDFDIEDVDAEMQRIDEDQEAAAKMVPASKPQPNSRIVKDQTSVAA